ncbi:GNAT family N-acetyltransferase [Alloactinosynnema sp. L-07]|uniref:GNAT family N-acetyltransferase n=1 Tax=Alloactinosynnema sp. L-07 TaxID=1653480 RepID=UPI0006B425ED|nr:GNAT family protein [Alloactinosynnema sp. L-07]
MLTGDLVRLRPLELDDADTLWRWNEDPEIMRWFDTDFPESLFQFRERFANRARDSWDRLALAIETRGDQRFVGIVQLRDTRHHLGRAELDIYLGEQDVWGKGIGAEAMRLICGFGFAKMRLHAIELSVVAENERARALYRKIGFSEDGRLRDAARHDGQWHDVIIMTLLEGELRV